MTKEQWANGNTIYGFNFAPDFGDDCTKMGFANPIKRGSLGFVFKFKTPLPEATTAAVYYEEDKVHEIDINRQVISDNI